MKFTYLGANLSEVIKRFKKEGNQYHIEYMDGSSTDFYCSDPGYEEDIKAIMYAQAVERQAILGDENYQLAVTRGVFLEILTTSCLAVNIANKNDFVAWLCGIGSLAALLNITKNIRIKRELEKYLLFFKLYTRLDEVNKAKFMECIEQDHFFQKRLDIDTVDNFTLGEVRTLYRHLQETKNRNN